MAITYSKLAKTAHRINFDAIGNVDIRLHCLIITMPRPFHFDIWWFPQ